jgi:hypothetical protein
MTDIATYSVFCAAIKRTSFGMFFNMSIHLNIDGINTGIEQIWIKKLGVTFFTKLLGLQHSKKTLMQQVK